MMLLIKGVLTLTFPATEDVLAEAPLIRGWLMLARLTPGDVLAVVLLVGRSLISGGLPAGVALRGMCASKASLMKTFPAIVEMLLRVLLYNGPPVLRCVLVEDMLLEASLIAGLLALTLLAGAVQL